MKLTITIDDEDRDQPGGEMWPFTLWLHDGPDGDEFEGFTGTGGSIIGDDIPTMLREAADQWPYKGEGGAA